ncbi:MAG: MFS transporter [Caldilineaceae bacterium]
MMNQSPVGVVGVAALPKVDHQRDYQIAWGATFLFFIAYYSLIVPLPRYLSDIGLSDGQMGLVLGATVIASLLTRPISGILTDRFGYKQMLWWGALFLTLGGAGVIFTTQVALLFGLRILQALGYVIFTTAGNALVGQLATPAERSMKIAYFGLAANFAMTMTPGVIDTILPWIGLTAAFWITGGLAVSAGVLSRALRYTGEGQPITQLSAKAWLHLWRFPRELWLSIFVSALFGAGFGAYFQFFAVLLERREIHPAGVVFAAYGLSIIVTRLLFGRYLDRIGFARVLALAVVMMVVGLALAAVGFSLPILIVAAALIAAGGGFFHPMLIAHHVTMLPSRAGWAVACFYFGFDAGIGIGAWILGAILDVSGLTALFVAAALLTLTILLFIPGLAQQRKALVAISG